jgi:hypothetical protein
MIRQTLVDADLIVERLDQSSETEPVTSSVLISFNRIANVTYSCLAVSFAIFCSSVAIILACPTSTT